MPAFFKHAKFAQCPFISTTHARIALVLKRLCVETIPVGYILVEPGMKIGELGEADLITRDNFWKAIGYALTAEFMGMDYVLPRSRQRGGPACPGRDDPCGKARDLYPLDRRRRDPHGD